MIDASNGGLVGRKASPRSIMSRLEPLCSIPTSFVGIQVAEQQGKYLAKSFNALAKDANAHIEPFNYRHMGSMASIGTLHTHENLLYFLGAAHVSGKVSLCACCIAFMML